MNRRDFFTGAIGSVQEGVAALNDDSPRDPQSPSKNSLAIQRSRNLVRSVKGLEAMSPQDWGTKTAAHLLRRTMFGPTRAEILQAASQSLDATLTSLMASQALPDAPIGPSPPLAAGQTWVNLPFDSLNDGSYANWLKAWWVGLMARQGMSIQEKMVLFWHNHFVSAYATVADSRFLFRQLALYRQNALGNFKQLVKLATIDPAMLRYLNGDTNTKAHANENYGREVQELFTIGKGPQIAQGNYTNYTEADVQAAAKVLTGFSDVGYRVTTNATIDYLFTLANHDTTNKQFSGQYGNTVIQGRSTAVDAPKELDDMFTMIFSQVDTDGVNKVARYMCRKLYRWFVYYDIDANAETNVIIPLANIMSSNNFEVLPVLNALFRSAHFYDDNNIGCMIKNPMDFIVGTVRQTGIPLPAMTDPNYYLAFGDLRNRAAIQEMNVLDPPSVAGWEAYYQIPDFYEIWVSTTTLPLRGQITDLLFTGLGSGTGTGKLLFDPIAFAKTMGTPADPFQLINDLATQLFPIPLTKTQSDYLMYNVMGLVVNGEGAWTTAWNAYWAAGGQTTANKNIVLKMLTPLLKFMFRMAEFQLG